MVVRNKDSIDDKIQPTDVYVPISRQEYMRTLHNLIEYCELHPEEPQVELTLRYCFRTRERLNNYEDRDIPVKFYRNKADNSQSFEVIN